MHQRASSLWLLYTADSCAKAANQKSTPVHLNLESLLQRYLLSLTKLPSIGLRRQGIVLRRRLIKLLNSSYPEGNFGGNQLLDGSISLSPLYPRMTNDLHVSTATSLHQSFP